MKLRQMAAAVAAGALVVSLAACSQGSKASGGQEAKGGGTVRVATTNDNIDGLKAVVEKFEAANPDTKIQLDVSPASELQATLRTQLSAGTAPDVFYVWPGAGNPMALDSVAQGNFLQDLSDKPWVSKLSDPVKSVSAVDGKQWIAPVTYTGIGAAYNMTALKAAGLTPPETWTDVLGYCKAAKDAGKVGYALGIQDTWVTQLILYSITPELVYLPDPQFAAEMAAGKKTFVGSNWQAAMDKYNELAKAGCFQDDPLGTSFDTSVSQVAKGDALGIVQVTAVLGGVQDQAPEGTELKVYPMPASDNKENTRMAGAVGVAFGINAKPSNKEGANAFLDYLMTDEGMAAYNKAGSSLPPFEVAGFEPDPSVATVLEYQESGRTYPFMDQQWPNPKVQQALFEGVQNMFAGKATGTDVLATMDKAYQEG